jgi:hypothetical protein
VVVVVAVLSVKAVPVDMQQIVLSVVTVIFCM